MQKILLIIGVIFLLNQGVYAVISPIATNESVQNEQTVKQILVKLEAKFGIHITYESDILKQLNVSNEADILKAKNIDEAFKLLLKESKLTYKKIRNDFFVIVEKNVDTQNASVTITGSIFDETNLPLPNATVVIKETKQATISDINGIFLIKLGAEAKTLHISFIGYKDVDIPIGKKTNFNIVLVPEIVGLDEVVVAGVAGKTSMKKLTVTVAKINAKELNEAPASSAASSLQGKVAGVRVVQGSGTPGSAASIRLRGSTSLTGNNSPLIMIDGNIFASSMADINVDDIKSMEIVKGAAAASLYGSKAGSGVILITTYRGSELAEGKTVVKIRNEFGTSSIARNIDLATHHPYQLAEDAGDFDYFTKYQGVRYDDDGNVKRGSRRLEDDRYADNPYSLLIDNQDEFYSSGNYYTNYISVSNRSEKTNIFLSFENNKQSGILFSTDGYKRHNFRINVDHRFNDKLKLSTSNLLINTTSDNPGSSNSFFDLLFLSPDVNLEQVNEDGTPYKIKPDPWSIEENPLYPLYYRERESTRTSLLSNVILNYKPTSWLNFDAKYTIEMRFKNWETYTPRGYLYGGGQFIDGSLYKEQYQSNYQTFQTTANFNKIFNNFTVKGKLSYLYEDESYSDFAVTGREFIVADIPQLGNTNAEKSTLNSYEGIIRSENIFGIADIDYKGKYLFSALYRKDGSSLFGENKRWNDYYRISAAYRITEDFTIPGFDELKIRVAYGTAGQRPAFSNQYETWNISNGSINKSTFGNKDLKPSESEELEFALDAYFLKRFNFQVSYSETDTKDAIALAPIPSHIGYPGQWKNVGTISSSALEATLGFKIIDNKSFKWNANITFDRIRQTITKLNVPQYQTGPNNAFLMREGETLGAIYGYRWLTSLTEMEAQLKPEETIGNYALNSDGYVIKAGTEGTQGEAAILWDEDGNGVADITKIGDGNPEFNLGLSSTFSWKDIQLYALFDFKNGGDVYNYTHQYTFRDNRAIEFDQYGKPDEEKKTINYYSTFYHHTALNSYFVEDATYLKLRELSLFYNLTSDKLGGLGKHVSLIRIGGIAHNLYTFTNYSGYDPEVASGSDLTNFPFDSFGYPNYRTYKVSLEINF